MTYRLLILRPVTCLCLSVNALLACEPPYKQCDESLKVGDELHFKLTEGPHTDEQVDDCAAELPFSVGSEFQLVVERFVGGEVCESSTGPLKLTNGSEFQWHGEFDRGGAAKFRGDYLFDSDRGCSYYFEFEFREGSLKYLANGANPNPCVVTCTTGTFNGVWMD